MWASPVCPLLVTLPAMMTAEDEARQMSACLQCPSHVQASDAEVVWEFNRVGEHKWDGVWIGSPQVCEGVFLVVPSWDSAAVNSHISLRRRHKPWCHLSLSTFWILQAVEGLVYLILGERSLLDGGETNGEKGLNESCWGDFRSFCYYPFIFILNVKYL